MSATSAEICIKQEKMTESSEITNRQPPDISQNPSSCVRSQRSYREESTLMSYSVHRKRGDRCVLCDKKFGRHDSMVRHMHTHLPFEVRSINKSCTEKSTLMRHTVYRDRRHRCDWCNKTFSRRDCLIRHMHTHLRPNPRPNLLCRLCGRPAWSKKSLAVHMGQVHKVASAEDFLFKCRYCDKSFPSIGPRNTHENYHTKPYRCDICDKSFAHLRDLKEHMNTHFPEVERLFGCHVCERTFQRRKDLVSHTRIHDEMRKRHRCRECNKGFLTKQGYRIHVLKHKDTKDYQCEKCGANFYTKADLQRHRGKGRGNRVKRYECNVCNKRFVSRSDCKRHERIHTGEKPYSCALCGKAFSSTPILKAHRRSHSNERPYSCSYCAQTFRSSGHLAIHRRKHTGEKESHACKECGKTFGFYSNLYDHMRTHKGEKRFKCEVCDISFRLPHHLRNHEKTASHKQRTEAT